MGEYQNLAERYCPSAGRNVVFRLGNSVRADSCIERHHCPEKDCALGPPPARHPARPDWDSDKAPAPPASPLS